MQTRTISNRAFFCNKGKTRVLVDSTVNERVLSGKSGQYKAFSTSFFLKIARDDGVTTSVSIDSSVMLSMASHILSQMDGLEDGPSEQLVGVGGSNILRAGILSQGPGISITVGSTEEYAQFIRSELRGFAESVKVIVAAAEYRMVAFKYAYDKVGGKQ